MHILQEGGGVSVPYLVVVSFCLEGVVFSTTMVEAALGYTSECGGSSWLVECF